jgi:hypothetical protein
MAAVEDPIHTHLGLGTDRTIDAIQAAAAAALYNPYSHFLPWRPSDATNNAEEGADGESNLHQPGLLIFRKDARPGQPSEYLAVFLIPELPTTGLDQEAFFMAQQIMADTVARTGYPTTKPHVIRFAGPNFSGSMASFADVDGLLHSSTDSDPPYSLKAFSGSITSPPDPPLPNLTLTQTSDCEAINAFLIGVKDYGYRPEEIAVVSEEGTEFGNNISASDGQNKAEGNKMGAKPPCQIVGPLFLHFPREISKLRNAYGAQAGQTPQTAQTPQSGASQADIAVNWQDSAASRGDDVPVYGGQQTPLSQQAALSSLTGILRRQNIKVLAIMATDPMDEAFLIRSFKKSSRDVRLLLRDPDLLYLRTLEAGSLNGTLLVGNYPLIPQNQFWSGDNQRNLLNFPSALQEAQYNAFLAVLEDLNLQLSHERLEWNWPAGSSHPSMQLPARMSPPPLWLAAIGTAGNLPLTILPPPPDQNKFALRSLNVGAPHYMVIGLLIVFTMLGLLHIWGLILPGTLPKLIAYDFFLVASTKNITASKALCHAAALSILALVQLILGSSFVFFGDAGSPYGWLRWGIILSTSVFVLAACGVLVALGVFYQKNWGDLQGEGKLSLRPLIGVVLVVVIFGALGAGWAWQVFPANFSNAFMHARDLNLADGIAPCLPITLMLVIVYLGCWAYLRRLTYWDYRKPKLPAVALDEVLPSDFNSKGGKMQGIDQCILTLLENRGWVFIFVLTFVSGLVAFRPLTTLDMVESLPVRVIARIVFALALFVLELNWFRFVNIWSLLRSILEDLERLPIHAAFRRMPSEKTMPIWRWGVSDNSFLPPAQAIDRLRALVREDNSVLDHPRVVDLQAKVVILGKFKGMGMERTNVWTSLTASWSNPQSEILEMPRAVNAGRTMFSGSVPREQQTILSSTPNGLVDLVLQTGASVADLVQQLILFLRPEYWRRGSDGSKPEDPPPPTLRKFILAEDLVALRYYNYIRYVVNELRNLLFFVAIAFSMLFLAFHVYAFRADAAIDGAFLFLFLILGSGIFLVLYQMEVDPILSHFGGSKSGEVGLTFYLDLLKYGAVPCLTILGAHVPMISNFLLRWLQPALESLH